MTKSLAPCVDGRISKLTVSDKSVEPAISVKDHPRPRRNNPIPSVNESWCGARAEISADAIKIKIPTWIVFTRPNLSLIEPTIGEKAYIPRT